MRNFDFLHFAASGGYSGVTMSKAFTKETETDDEDDLGDDTPALPAGTKNYMTQAGFEALRREYRELLHVERSGRSGGLASRPRAIWRLIVL